MNPIVRTLLLLFAATSALKAQVPDLTNGGVPDSLYFTLNLGPTGLEGWVHSERINGADGETTNARQFLITGVDPGSPADGILAVDDVILGASGNGAAPTNFTYDARQAFAAAINAAEANNPAILKVLRWRGGSTAVVNLTLQTLGSYSATAPYNCPKSTLILERAVQKSMLDGEDNSYGSLGTLLLLAVDDPSNPDNAARQAKAAAQAHSIIPTPEKMEMMMNGWVDRGGQVTWRWGYNLMVLSEYYLATGDPEVVPAIQAISNMLGNGADLFGAYGHGFGRDPVPSTGDTLAIPPYGPVNAAGVGCFLGLSLAEKCGLATPKALATLENANNFYGSFVNRGTVPYGENQPGDLNNGSNGKEGAVAMAFALQPERVMEAHHHALHAAASSSERQVGHSTAWFSQFWTPLGAAVGGEQAAIEHFSRMHWMIDLNRNWKGGFDYNALTNEGQHNNTPAYRNSFYMSFGLGLTYALPLKKIALTGKYANPSLALNASELQQVALADGYRTAGRAATRTNAELLEDLKSFSPPTRKDAALQIKARTSDYGYFLPALTAMVNDYTSPGCKGACLALGYMNDPSTIPLLVNLLTCPDVDIRWVAAEGLRWYSRTSLLPFANQIMDAAIANAKPMLPIDPVDPLQDAQGMLSFLLFYGGSAKPPQGIFAHSLAGIDKQRMYQVVKVFAQLPRGDDRSNLQYVYEKLSEEDMLILSGTIIDTVVERAPADGMFGDRVQNAGVDIFNTYGYAETVPLAKSYVDQYKLSKQNFIIASLDTLTERAGSCLLVEPDPKILEWCEDLLFSLNPGPPVTTTQQLIAAINADTNPQALPALKAINSLTADSPVLTLPSNRTVLRLNSYNHGSESIFTWRKVHGPGEVTFAPYNNPDDGSRTVIFDGVPGNYLFEVTLGDSRHLTEVKQTVAVRLEMVGGGVPANNPPVATPQNLSVSQGLSLPIILTGTDPEGYALSYAATTDPAHGTLSGTPPLIQYIPIAGYLGNDSFEFEAMDSEGQVSTATISISVNNTTPVGVAIYEPFNYAADSTLNGKSGSGDVGFAAPWVASSTTVRASSLGDGSILTKGGQISNSFKAEADRSISAAALKDRGLLDDGATLWFSGYFGLDLGNNVGNGRFGFALANSAFPPNTADQLWIQDEGPLKGSGIGFTIDKYWNNTGTLQATEFRDLSQGGGLTGYVRGSWEGAAEFTGRQFKSGTLDYYFYVCKIKWGIDADHVDRIEIYQTRTPNVLPEHPCSVLEFNVDQSTFDTLTIRSNSYYVVDEIRFGENLNSVLAGSVAMTDDVSAPTPNPLSFYKQPTVSGLDAISMSAMPAADPNGVEYYFTCTAGGGNDSGWQSSREYTDTGLTPGVTYSYTIKTRDLTLAQNTSSASAASSATIPAEAVVTDASGISRASAEYLLAEAGLTLGKITYGYDPSVSGGSVISQSLAGGSSASFGSVVDLVISLGAEPIAVPNVENLTQSAAQTAITNAGFAVGSVTTRESNEAAGEVISQSPPAGLSAIPGTQVNLVVSTGPSPATGVVSVANVFSFKGDLATNAAYSSNPGNDGGGADLYGANKPITIPVSGFTSAGSDKLVGVLNLHNSGAINSAVTGLTYGGVDVFTSNKIFYRGSGSYTSQIFFYLDNPTTDGNLVISLGASANVDEVGLVLFALNGTQPGYLAYNDTGNSVSPSLTVPAGAFVLGDAHRNGSTNNTVAAPFTGVDLYVGSMNAEAAYLIAGTAGTYLPVYSVSGVVTSIASFAAVPATVSTTVPNVSDSTQSVAQSTLSAAGLVVGTVIEAFDEEVPAGKVISQSPAAGSTVATGNAVNLVISLGPDPNPRPLVPNVVGLSQSAAELAITNAGLTVSTVTDQYNNTIAAGNVISQNPLGNSIVDEGSGVDLVVSLGPEPVAVPNVIGFAQTGAESLITGAGLAIGNVTSQFSNTVPLGKVISQNPAGGLIVISGTSVDLLVSLGPDSNPPPIPTFVTPLGPVDNTKVTVSANPVTDPEGNGVQYLFRNTTLNTNSGWLSSPTWTNTGLNPSTTYSYTVRSRDTSVNLNVSAESSPQSATTLAAEVRIAGTFSYKVDAANSASFSSNPGNDGGQIDLYGANSPLTIPVSGFTAAGCSKLVAVVSLHNSSARVAPVTSVTYGGVELSGNLAAGTSLGGDNFARQFIFYLDDVTSDGNLVIGFDSSTYNIDEIGVTLFALNGTQAGNAVSSQTLFTNTAFNATNANVGDLIVGVAQRNNQNSLVANAPYTGVDMYAGNLNAEAGYLVATTSNPAAPTFNPTNVTPFVKSFAVFAAERPLPLPWVSTDIGTGMLPGSANYNSGTFTHSGSGLVGSTGDKLCFTYQTLTNDGEIVAKISALQDTGTSSFVGVMIRDSLAANSKQICMGMTGAGTYRWLSRTTTAGTTSSTDSGTGTPPDTWVRLVRSGTTINAYTSTNGTTWTLVGSATNSTFAANCYIGLAVGSGSDANLNNSQFSNVSVTP